MRRTPMSNPRKALTSLLHRLGVAGPARVRGFQGIGAARIGVLATLASLLTLLAVAAPQASAEIVHEFLPKLSEELSKGAPVGCGAGVKEPPEGPCVSGASSGPDGTAFAAGSLWLTDSVALNGGNGHQTDRVDRFDPVSGAFVAPQLDQTEATGELIYGPVGVAEAFGEQLVYVHVSAGLAVYGASSGKLVGIWSGAHTANGGFSSEASSPVALGVAADGSVNGLDVAKGDVYVVTAANGGHPEGNVVDVFTPSQAKEAGVEPEKTVAELRGTCAVTGEVVTGATPCASSASKALVPFTGQLGAVTVSPVNGDVLVNDAGVVDVFEPGALPGTYTFVRRISEANGTPLGITQGLAVDGNGDIYDRQGGVLDQFSETGMFEGQLNHTPAGPFGTEIGGVAVDPVSHDVFVGNYGGSPPVAAFGPSAVIPDVTTSAATVVHATHVQLNGTVKLDGAGSAACVFEYGTSTSYGSEIPCEPETVTEAEEVPVGHTGAREGQIEGLLGDTTYFYRVRATNSNGLPSREGSGNKDEVSTPGTGLHGESVSDVASTSATLEATLDPHNAPTGYYFQYSTSSTTGCTPATCAELPAAPGVPIGSTAGDLAVSQHLQDLSATTTYHYRVAVLSEPEPGETVVFYGPDQTFTTQPAGGELALPDGRQWELVTPPNKEGAMIKHLPGNSTQTDAMQAAADGSGIAYSTTVPMELEPSGYGIFEEALSRRGAQGWSTRDISAPNGAATRLCDAEYQFFSLDLSSALQYPECEEKELDVALEPGERTHPLRTPRGFVRFAATRANVINRS